MKQIIKYAIGDIEFLGNVKYMRITFVEDSLIELCRQRAKACTSHSSLVYQIDFSSVRQVKSTQGISRAEHACCKVIKCEGYYFDVLDTIYKRDNLHGWIYND